MTRFISPEDFVKKYAGKAVDLDGAYGVQCVDGFRVWCRDVLGYSWPTKTGWASGYWEYRFEHADEFDFITDPAVFQDGDWCIWKRGSRPCPDSHVAMYYQGKFFGQRQSANRAFCLKKILTDGVYGALRWKGYEKIMNIPKGYSKQTINGHTYTMYCQSETEKAAVLSAGNGQLRSIAAHDADVLITAKLAGANFFQMKENQADPYGTHYGDESAPLNGVYVIVPGQDSTMYYNLDSGEYGDSKGYYPDREHNVFSPSLIFPAKGNYQYARMVGINHVNYASMYAALVRLTSGKHIMAITQSALTPKQIYEDLKAIKSFLNMAILDGGDSAQMACWHDGAMDYVRKTSRLIPSVVCFYKPKTSETVTNDQTVAKDYKAEYEALTTKYENLKKVNQENLETVSNLKTDYEARIEKAIKVLKGEE